jgi:hypothetical protein
MMQAAKKIPFEDPNVLMGVRGLYILSNVIIFGVYMYTKMQIDKKRGTFVTVFSNAYFEEGQRGGVQDGKKWKEEKGEEHGNEIERSEKMTGGAREQRKRER